MTSVYNRRFETASISLNAVRLRCRENCSLLGNLTALVQGIELGSINVSRSLVAGDIIDLPINYFPHVVLPAEVRFALEDVEISPPLTISSAEDVMKLIGPGRIAIEELSLDSGLLRGVIVNLSNGVHFANAYIRINHMVVRSVVVEPPRVRVAGGAISFFAVPIRISDFLSNGVHLEIHIAGIAYPVGSVSYVLEQSSSEKERIIALEENIRQLKKSAAVQIESVMLIMERRLSIQQERLDAFIEYSISLLIGTPPGEWNEALGKAAEESMRVLANGNRRSEVLHSKNEVSSPAAIVVPVESELLTFGWYGNEINEHGTFRWMGQTALIRSPTLIGNIDRIELTISQIYGADRPMLSASIDDMALESEVQLVNEMHVVTFTVPRSQVNADGGSLYIESFATGCPALDSGTNDARTLSVAVTKIEFFYRA